MKRREVLGFFMGGGAALASSYACSQGNRSFPSQANGRLPINSSLNSSTTLATQCISPDYFGLNVGTELSWETWRSDLLKAYQQLETRWLRVWYNWADIEPQPGNYQGSSVREALQLAKEKGFRILFVVWGTPSHAGDGELESIPQTKALTNYCRWLQTNLGDLVDAWEIGNEPNLEKYYSGSPADYVQTLATAYQVFQGQGLVIAAGSSGAAKPSYWQALIDSGLEQHCDRVNLHPYRHQPQQVVRLVDDFLQRVKKPLWITELGLSTDIGGEQGKADFVTGVIPLLTSRVEQLFWYRGIQGAGLHPLRFGLVEGNRATKTVTPLPAYYAYATQARKCREATIRS